MCDPEILRNCEVDGCYKIAVERGNDYRQLCGPHFLSREVDRVRRQWCGRSWRNFDPVPAADWHLIGVWHVYAPATHWPPGHYYAKCDVCDESGLIGPTEYPYPACETCVERYERRRRGEV
jgi:hypothetical protein